MKAVYNLIQLYKLDSGEISVHVDTYATKYAAEDALEHETTEILLEIIDNDAQVLSDERGELNAVIIDSNNNAYELSIELSAIKEAI